jgi:tetratricopeptide (TPR) repeat protein
VINPNKTGKHFLRLILIILVSILPLSLFTQQRWQSAEVMQREMEDRFRMAQQLEGQGQLDQALDIYRLLFEQDNRNTRYYQRYSALLFRFQKYAELKQVITKYLQVNPRDDNAVVDLGKLYFSRGDTAQADQYWTEALDRFKYSQNFFRALYTGLISIQQYDRADEVIKKVRQHYHQENLFAQEVAYYQMQRGNYLESAREYLLFARSDPRYYLQVSSQILRFPHDSSLFKGLDSLLLRELSQFHTSRELHQLRADVLFKFQQYPAAIAEIMNVESLNQYRGNDILDLANDLLNERQFALAEGTYTRIIGDRRFSPILAKALLGLADAFEKEIMAEQELSPFDYFYRDNFFFVPDYLMGINMEEQRLQQSFAIYDSVITNLPRSNYTAQALYRLAELRYRILDDLDGAQKLYEDAIKISTDRDIRSLCGVRLADLMIAKGALPEAEDFIRKNLKASAGSTAERMFAARLSLVDFFQGEIDSVLTNRNELLGLLGINDPLFNDVIEFTNFIGDYLAGDYLTPAALKADYISAELYIRQNKLSQAREKLNYIVSNYPSAKLALPARFRLLQIELFFRYYESAEKIVRELMNSEALYTDNALFMLADLAQNRDHNPEYAAQWYELILEKYPNSLYCDPARKRLREMQSTAIKKDL